MRGAAVSASRVGRVVARATTRGGVRAAVVAGVLAAALAVPGTVQASVPSTQHSAQASVRGDGCNVTITVTVADNGDDNATFIVKNTDNNGTIPVVLTYIGFPEGEFKFDYTIPSGSSANGNYEFTITKTDGNGAVDITNPVIVPFTVEGLDPCLARVRVSKVTPNGAGGPFTINVRDSQDGVVVAGEYSTSQAGTPVVIVDSFLEADVYSIQELFEVGDPGDPSTWDAGDGFQPGDIECTLYDDDDNVLDTVSVSPSELGSTLLSILVKDGEFLDCTITNLGEGSGSGAGIPDAGANTGVLVTVAGALVLAGTLLLLGRRRLATH